MRTLAFCLIAGIGLSGFASSVRAAEPATQQPAAEPSRVDAWLLQGLLDPETPQPARDGLRTELMAAVRAGDVEALYVAGSLYRQGPSHPAQVLPLDLDKARELLLQASLKGSLPAMAKLAQVEFDAGRYAEAMDWAQVFSYYWREFDDFDESRALHLKDLLKRIGDKLGVIDDEALRRRVIAVLDRYGAKIETAIAERRARQAQQTQHSPLRVVDTRGPASRPRRVRTMPDESGLAEFYLAIDAKGRVARFWLLDAVPDAAMADKLDDVFRTLRFNEIKSGESVYRFGLQTVAFSKNKLNLQRR